MNTKAIRKLIADASAIEEKSGVLENIFFEKLKIQEIQNKELAAKGLVLLVKRYIEHVPDLLEEAEHATHNTPWWNYISPILETAQQYFFNSEDLIPDRLGLLGLLDDAYLAHTMLQSVSGRFRQLYGKPLLAEDLTEINNNMRLFIGESIGSELDNYARQVVEGPDIQNVMQQLFAFANNPAFYPIPDVSFGGLSASEYANLQADIFIYS